MAHVNKDEAAAAQASRLPLSERMAHVHISRISELPRIELYLDQVLAIVAGELAPVMLPGEVAITGSMVNNYVKLHFLAPPVNRRYDRLAIASLFVIAIFKPVYTIEEIAYLIRLSLGHSERQVAYNQFCDYVESAVECAFNRTSMEKEENPDDPRQLLWNACNAFACQLYVRKIYLQDALSGGEGREGQ